MAIGLSNMIKEFQKQKHKYTITPVYADKNIIKINLNCIIKIKMIHIICVLYILMKKRRVEKHERTSNRRTYDYSYE
jgi:hypothetical protein